MIKEARWSGWVWVGECSFWYRPTRVVPDQRPLNGRCCCCCILLNSGSDLSFGCCNEAWTGLVELQTVSCIPLWLQWALSLKLFHLSIAYSFLLPITIVLCLRPSCRCCRSRVFGLSIRVCVPGQRHSPTSLSSTSICMSICRDHSSAGTGSEGLGLCQQGC